VVDLNADLGEGMATDEQLLAIVTSANVACGFHAGDAATMQAICEAAAAHDVTIGAHPGYRDREGFGRRELGVAPATIREETEEQIRALQEHGAVAYVKPHGALYTRANGDAECAEAIVAATVACGVGAMLTFPGSELERRAAEAGLDAVAEGFADRGYGLDGLLVPRDQPGALLDADAAARQAVRLARQVRSICLHGDSPGAVELARRVADELSEAGIDLQPFA
jgi:5-oxoprolinase (ATP-hydrolysing) subunit A